MLNPVLQNSLLPEHRVLYDLNLYREDKELAERIRQSVRHIRKINTNAAKNKLEDKLKQLGNNGGWYRSRVKELIKKLYKQKSVPGFATKNMLGKWRSIEFELIFRSQEACEEFCYAARAAGIADYVTIQKDDSIRRNDYDVMGVPHEVTITYSIGNEDAVRAFCKCLKGRAYVNKSCGTHFHIDMRHSNPEKATEYGNRLALAVPALRLLLPVERRENKYCNKIINTTKTECVKCRKLSCNCHIQPHKYAFVNLAAYNKHRTIEVRGHSGTIKADKILNWIKLCEHIMLTPVPAQTQITTVDDLLKGYKLDKELTAYVIDRFNKFSGSDWSYPQSHPVHKTEGEENPADHVDVPAVIHPAFLAPVPAAKVAQAAPQHPIFVGGAGGNAPWV